MSPTTTRRSLPPDLDDDDNTDDNDLDLLHPSELPDDTAGIDLIRPTRDAPYGKCQHPRSMQAGICKRDAVGVYDIPPLYKPPQRHARQPDVPRPRAPLCRQHRGMVEDFALNGKRTVRGHLHEAHCDVCRHPDCDMIETQWVNWRMGTDEAVRLLDVSHRTWYNHVDHFNLMVRKTKRDKRKRFLAEMMEKGMRGGGHNARTALTAAAQLAREEGDQPVETTQHSVVGMIGHVDLTKLSEKELAEQLRLLAHQLESGAATKAKPALAEEVGGVSGNTIDIPRSSVRSLATNPSSKDDD